jgi:hypothetical protein
VATAALKRKKASEQELDRLGGTRLQLETQVNTLESANLNAETMAAMKKASDALKVIHGNMYVVSTYSPLPHRYSFPATQKDGGQGRCYHGGCDGTETGGRRDCGHYLESDRPGS